MLHALALHSFPRLLAAAALTLLAGPGGAASLAITRVADSFDPVPDRPGATFVIPGGAGGRPTLAGGRIVFQAWDGLTSALWSVDADGGTPVRLVDTATPMPGATGAVFGGLDWYRAAGRTLAFHGTDWTAHSGYYTVSLAGGPIRRLADQDTPVPAGGGATFGRLIGGGGGVATDGFDYDGRTLVFDDAHGVYAIDAATREIRVIGDGRFAICLSGYGFGGVSTSGTPAVSGATVVTHPYNVFGQRAVVATPVSGITGVSDACAGSAQKAANVTPVATGFDAAPADPLGRTLDMLGFRRPLVDGSTVLFANALWNPALNRADNGLYARSGSGAPRKVADAYTVPAGEADAILPDLSGYALSAPYVVFTAIAADGVQGLYGATADGAQVRRLLRVGDLLPDGRRVFGLNGGFAQPVMQNRSLAGRQVAVRLEFTDPVRGWGVGIYRIALVP